MEHDVGSHTTADGEPFLPLESIQLLPTTGVQPVIAIQQFTPAYHPFYSFSLDSLALRIHAMGLLTEKSNLFKSYGPCLVGSEFVDFCISTRQCSARRDAVRLGQAMIDAGYLRPAGGDKKFEDGQSYYSMVKRKYEIHEPAWKMQQFSNQQRKLTNAAREFQRSRGLTEDEELQSVILSDRREDGAYMERLAHHTVHASASEESWNELHVTPSPSLSNPYMSSSDASSFQFSASILSPAAGDAPAGVTPPSPAQQLTTSALRAGDAPTPPSSALSPPHERPRSATDSGGALGALRGGGRVLMGVSMRGAIVERQPMTGEDLEELAATVRALNERTVRAGFLEKQGHRFKNWRKRWFVLKGHTLSYYRRQSDKAPAGTIDLCEFTLEKSLQGNGLRMRLLSKQTAGLEYLLEAKTELDFIAWVKSISLTTKEYDALPQNWRQLVQVREWY